MRMVTANCDLLIRHPESRNIKWKFPSSRVTFTALLVLKRRCFLLTYLYYSNWPTGSQANYQLSVWVYPVECISVKKAQAFLLSLSQGCVILHFLWVLASILNTGDLQCCMVNCENVPLEGVKAPLAAVPWLNAWWTGVRVLTLL